MSTIDTIVLKPQLIDAENVRVVLDEVARGLREGQSDPVVVRLLMDRLVWDLFRIRQLGGKSQWQQIIDNQIRSHEISKLVVEDPLTKRALLKPRGYPGDAILLDLISRQETSATVLTGCSELGRAIYECLSNGFSPIGVRNRTAAIALEIDDLAAEKEDLEVFSVGCGHLREAGLSRAVVLGQVARYIGLDHDGETVDYVNRVTRGTPVIAVEGDVLFVIRNGLAEFGRFDFIYAAGLYDYLSDRLSKALLRTLFAMLNPGGKLWIANFLPDGPEAGYMEGLMDWWLIYRSPSELKKICAVCPANQIGSYRVFKEPQEAVAFLEVCKARK